MKIRTFGNTMVKCAGIAAALLVFAMPARAEPKLQIDINGGTYDAVLEDVVAPGSNFTLLALCDTSAGSLCTSPTTFKLSIALTPKTSASGDYGSIVVNGVTYQITADMVYGTPPVESFQLFDPGDLSKHGIYDTYFLELAVDFNTSDTCGAPQYNVANTPGNCNPSGTSSYYDAFAIDASGLNSGYGLHFDLYDASQINGYDVDLPNSNIAFAPFSKDARYDCCNDVPEPNTLALLGLGLLGVGIARRRRLLTVSRM